MAQWLGSFPPSPATKFTPQSPTGWEERTNSCICPLTSTLTHAHSQAHAFTQNKATALKKKKKKASYVSYSELIKTRGQAVLHQEWCA